MEVNTSGSLIDLELSREEIFERGLQRPFNKFISFPVENTDFKTPCGHSVLEMVILSDGCPACGICIEEANGNK